MACDLNEAVKIVEGLISKTNVNDKKAKLRGIIDRINKLALQSTSDAHQLVVQDSTDNGMAMVSDNKIDVEIDDTSALPTAYGKLFVDAVGKLVEHTVSVDNEVLLENIRNDISKLVPADYTPETKNIRVVSDAISELELNMATLVGVDKKAVEELYAHVEPLGVEDVTGRVEELTNSYAYKTAVRDAANKEADRIATTVKTLDKTRLLVHELTHAATVAFMRKKPETKREQQIQDRINMLFKDAKQRYAQMATTMKVGKKPYWTKNVEEFLAEAVSNPETIKLLDNMKTNKKGRLSTVLRVLVDALAAIVGSKSNKDSVYFYTLDSILAIIEDTGKQAESKLNNGTISEVIKRAGLTDVVDSAATAELQKLYSELPQVVEFAVNNAKGCY